jgi:hypothetical protein
MGGKEKKLFRRALRRASDMIVVYDASRQAAR